MARNPDPGSRLPYLVGLPLPGGDVVLKAREPWPRTGAVYRHPADGEWPEPKTPNGRAGPGPLLPAPRRRHRPGPRPAARAPLAAGVHPGPGPERSYSGSRPGPPGRPGRGPGPGRRAAGLDRLTILVDTRERYPWRFTRQRAAAIQRRALLAGDYAVEAPGGDGLAAVVERKTLADLAGSLVDGSLNYLLAELAALPRRRWWSRTVTPGCSSSSTSRPGSWPTRRAPWPSATRRCRWCSDTRPLAQEWTYRFLGAAVAELTPGARGEVEILLVAECDAQAAGDLTISSSGGTVLTRPAHSAIEMVEILGPTQTTTSP